MIMNIQEQVWALYKRLGRWKWVSKACNARKLHHSRGYYQQIGSGRIKNPSAEVIAGIEYAPTYADTMMTAPKKRELRGTIVIVRSLWLELQEERLRKRWSWDELMNYTLTQIRRAP